MSTKEEKPTLAGVNVKTRKRNVAVPHDPAGFADSVLALFEANCSQVEGVEAKLAAAGKALDTADLDFSRYGDTLFEIYFAGARMGIGAKLAGDEKNKIDFNILACNPETKDILPFVKAFAGLLRRRPFLVKRLETVVCKLLSSLEFFDEVGRQKIAIATALMFTEKIGILPEEVFESLMNDRLVAKGTVLEVLTAIFREFLKHSSMEELVVLLTKAKVAHRLLEFFPPGRQSEAAFEEHFKQAGLNDVVDWQLKKVQENAIANLRAHLLELFEQEAGVDAYLDAIKAGSERLPKEEIVRVIWSVMVQTLNLVGKNSVQVLQLIVKSIKGNLKLLQAHTTSAKLELQLLNCVQISCYEDNKLLKLFVDIVKVLYDTEVVGEDTIMFWYKKGSSSKGRNVFLNDIEPFIKWLDEAEAEEEDEEEEDD